MAVDSVDAYTIVVKTAHEVLIIGGGLAGLSCARHLAAAGIACQVLEASDAVGGRARTDRIEGFLCDRGFQVFLPAYPEAQRLLDYDLLDLKPFEPGALIRYGGKFHRLSDPWRRPAQLLATAIAPVGSLADKLRVASLRREVQRGTLQDLFARPETTTEQRLREFGFSERMLERFFRPFLGGIFLDHSLTTSSRVFDFVFRMFAKSQASLPATGMGAIAEQLAAGLPAGAVRCGAEVSAVGSEGVKLVDGEFLPAAAVVLATDATTANRLLGDRGEGQAQTDWCGTTCFYFAAEKSPLEEPVLVLNGEGVDSTRPINSLCVPSTAAPDYAPARAALVSVSVVGSEPDESLPQRVVAQLESWFGPVAAKWRLLGTYRLPQALPAQPVGWLKTAEQEAHPRDGIFLAGDYRQTASIQGALASGRHAAESVIQSYANGTS